MALQTYTYQQLQDAAQHAIGRTPASTTSLGQIVNDALAYLCTAYPWSWRNTSTTLDHTASQAFVNLPADFGEVVSIRSTSSARGYEPTTLDRIIEMRQVNASLSGLYFYAVTWAAQTGTSTTPLARIELFPTPSATDSGAIRLVYRKQVPTLATAGHYPDVPSIYHPLLKQLVRAFAVSDEQQQSGADWDRFNVMLDRFIKLDGTQQQSFGRIPNQFLTTRYDNLYPYNGLTA